MTDPIAAFASAFGDNLRAKQRKELRKVLRAKHLELFDDLFCSDTDDEAIANYQRIADEVPPQSLMKLALILDAEQQAEYATFAKLVHSELEKRAQAEEAQPAAPTEA